MLQFIKDNFIWLFIIGLLLTSSTFFFNQSKDTERELLRVNGELYEVLNRDIDTVYVEKVITEVKEGRTIYVETEVPVEVIVYKDTDVDTTEILTDYFSRRIYSDTLRIDERSYVFVRDTISQNQIVNRYWEANIEEKVITETVIVRELPKLEIWAGFTTSTNMQIGGSFAVITPQKNHFGLDVGVYENNGLTPYIGVRYLWQIK